jgi:hypothetical protein
MRIAELVSWLDEAVEAAIRELRSEKEQFQLLRSDENKADVR